MTPLPRFHRLPAERQEAILAVARAHFAEHGPASASYNKIIEAAGFSKTAAYQYFDGREDLLAAVLDDVLDRLLGVLGPWTPARDEADFWARLEAGSRALVAHLRAHPDDLALADAAVGRARGGVWLGWFGAVVEDGRRLGFIRTDVDPDLLAGATAAVMRAADAWALHALNAAPPERPTARPVLPGGEQVWSLLRGLWSGGADGGAGRAH
ncbi:MULTISPECIES: TetR/AcrR family transcriptional regulator [Streptomyces]|uniref:TetR/AcrR family transcriptional regulator n=1 Tax=Streptomyces virginiae TaxID=1961 RepID=A0ABZ1T5Z1_STRVG|nr:TetR/AcrR family transcriptional regulator [Streptomyces virginiae]WTB20772.1 TetR/AcrR family transcriptional regulator [Streptomyces virginiae]